MMSRASNLKSGTSKAESLVLGIPYGGLQEKMRVELIS